MLRDNAVPDAHVLASLPIFPLPNVVLLPGMVLPLNVFEPRYLELVDFAREHGQHVGVPLLATEAREGEDPLAIEPVFGVGQLVFHVALPDGRRIIRLEGVCRVCLQSEHPRTRGFRQVQVTPLDEPRPLDSLGVAVLRAQVERIARYCGEGGDSLSSLLGIGDVRVFLYALTAFLPSLELMVADDDSELLTDRRGLVSLQQRSLAAGTADARVHFLSERTTAVITRLSQLCVTPPSLLQ